MIDGETGGNLNTKFVAIDPNHIPSVNSDKYNLKFLISSILKLQQQSQQQLSIVSKSLTSIHQKISLTDASVFNASAISNSLDTSFRTLPKTPLESARPPTSAVNAEVTSASTEQSRKQKLDISVVPFVPGKQRRYTTGVDCRNDAVFQVEPASHDNAVSHDDAISHLDAVSHDPVSHNDAVPHDDAVSRIRLSPLLGRRGPPSQVDAPRHDAGASHAMSGPNGVQHTPPSFFVSLFGQRRHSLPVGWRCASTG